MANFLSFGNYAGENYGYDFKRMNDFFNQNQNLLPANGTTYQIPASLGGGVGTFNASDYTIRNSAGQTLSSIDMSRDIDVATQWK